MDIKTEKTRARHLAKKRRSKISADQAQSAALELINHLPTHVFRNRRVGGFWPLLGEIDLKPLMNALYQMDVKLALPCTPRKGKPLIFRDWNPNQKLKSGPYGTKEPYPEAPVVLPDLVLLPLLAFTNRGERLGYGGGFYDRTLAALAEYQKQISGSDQTQTVFTCGIAFDVQRTELLPVDIYDRTLDAMLTENGFETF